MRPGLLQRLTGGRLLHGLPVLHEPGRKGPIAQAWLDGPAAQQDAPVVVRDTAGDDPRVLVVNGPAMGADKPRQVIARRNAQLDGLAALAAEVHTYDIRTGRLGPAHLLPSER